MSIRSKYFLSVFILHIVLTILVYKVLEDRKILFILSELLILLSIGMSVFIYRSFIQPIELMRNGTNAIKDEDFNVQFLKTGSSEVDHLISTFNTMLDRLRTEKVRTYEQSYFLENMIEDSPIGIIILDFDNLVSEMNPKAMEMLDIEDFMRKPLEELSSELATQLSKIIPGSKKIVTIDSIKKYKCRVRSIIHKGFLRKFIIIEELSDEILGAERKTYGKIIRMMSHEVNNSVGAINSILNTIHENAFGKGDDKWRNALNVAVNRNTKLGKFMRNFAEVVKIPNPTLSSINLNKMISEIAATYEPYAKEKNIQIELKLPTLPIHQNIDEALIEQVLINIIKNSIESIHEQGKIILVVSNSSPHIQVIDDGPGISEDIKEDLFSPFFSTKMEGQGIGLMLIKEILRKHNASFRLYTDHSSSLTFFNITFADHV